MKLYAFYITNFEEADQFINLIHSNNNQLLFAYRTNQIRIIPLVSDDTLAKKINSEFPDFIVDKLPQDNITQGKLFQGNYENIFVISNPNSYLPKFPINSSRIPINVQKYNEFRYYLANPLNFFNQSDNKTGDDRKISEDEILQAFEILAGLHPRETNWKDVGLMIVGMLWAYKATEPYLKFSNTFVGQFSKAANLTKEQEEKLTTYVSISVALANGEITARTFKATVEQIYAKIKGAITKRDIVLFLMFLGICGISVVQAIPNIKYAQESDAADPSQKFFQPASNALLGARAINDFFNNVLANTIGNNVIIKAREELIGLLNQLAEKKLDWSHENLLINGKTVEDSETVAILRKGLKWASGFFVLYYSAIYAKMGFETFQLDTEELWKYVLEFLGYLLIAITSGAVKQSLLMVNAWFPTIDKFFDLFGKKIVNGTEKPAWKTIFDILNVAILTPTGILSMANAAEIIVKNGPFKSTELGYLIFAFVMAYLAAGPINTGDMISNHADFVKELVNFAKKIYSKYQDQSANPEEFNKAKYGEDFHKDFIPRLMELIAQKSGSSIYADWTEPAQQGKGQVDLDDDRRVGNSTLEKLMDTLNFLIANKDQVNLNKIYRERFLPEYGKPAPKTLGKRTRDSEVDEPIGKRTRSQTRDIEMTDTSPLLGLR